ncbi:hypothetical protein ANRL1_03233 [Anaerolineae bacterium]|nr:hypothetical protein ANRL1_03233 [Anaerolineae bacterium]
MQKPMNLGIAMAILGFLLTCCLCPLAINSLLLIATSTGRPTDVVSLYGRIFAERMGNLTLSSYVIAAQQSLACLLALVILVLGIVAVVQARKANA